MTTFTGTSGKDNFIGGAGDDVFIFNALNLSAADIVNGGGGLNVLELVNTESLWQELPATRWHGLAHIDAIALISYGYGFDLSFSDSFYTTNQVKLLTIDGHALTDVTQGLHVHAENVTNMAFRIIGTSGGEDDLHTGAGNDIFAYAADSLNIRDSMDGGGGVNTLLLIGAGEVVHVKDGPDYVSPIGYSYLGDVKNIDNIVITGLDKKYTREIGFGNEAGTSIYAGTGVVTVSSNKNYGSQKASAPVDGTIVVDGSQLTAKQILHVTGGTSADTLTGGAANDSLTGGAGDDQLTGGGGRDKLFGGTGNDTLIGGLGADTMTGAAGDDTFDIGGSHAGRGTEFNHDHIDGGLGNDTLQFTSNQGIRITSAGLASNNVAGVETLAFASDHSSIALSQAFLAQNHDADGGLKITEGFVSPTYGGVGLDVDASKVTDKSLFINVVVSIANDQEILKGGAGNDVFDFNNNIFSSGSSGLDFFDRIIGGAGTDTIVIQEGQTAVLGTGVLGVEKLTVVAATNVAASGTTTEIDLAVKSAITVDGSALGTNGQLVVHGNAWDKVNHPYDGVPVDATGKLTIIGGHGNDTLVGGLGADRITGGDGNDIIYGRDGGDTLTGGAGADDFVYSNSNDSPPTATKRDTITDFSHAQGDLIYFLHNSTPAFTFIGDAAFGNSPGQVRSYHDSSATYVELDLNGDKQADFQVVLQGVMTLQAADFSL